MTTNFDDELVPELKEGISKVEWVDINDISKKLENTFGNIKELLIVE